MVRRSQTSCVQEPRVHVHRLRGITKAVLSSITRHGPICGKTQKALAQNTQLYKVRIATIKPLSRTCTGQGSPSHRNLRLCLQPRYIAHKSEDRLSHRRWVSRKLHILILIAGFWPHQALTASVQEPLPPPADPNDAPFMDPPYGQRKPTPSPTILPLNSLHHDKRRFQLTLAPLYASFRLPLLGRPENQFIHGAGAGIEADLRM